jgi:hypothetical protein
MNIPKVNELIAAVKLDAVRLVDCTASARIRDASEAPGVSISISRSAKVASPPNNGRFYVLASIRAKVEDQDEKKSKATPLVSVKATFELAYELPEVFTVSNDDLKVFADTNGVFNAWPYWREFLQSTLQRMALPPIVLPLLTMKQIVSNLDQGPAAQRTTPEKVAATG